MSVFEKGRARTGGRARGTRNRLSHSFLEALHADFLEHGESVIKIVRVEKPHEWLKIIAGLMPKELDIMTSNIEQISDEELDALLEHARRQLAAPRQQLIDGTVIYDNKKTRRLADEMTEAPSLEQLKVLEVLEAERQRRRTEDKLSYYVPYVKQRDFHSAGATHRERLLLAGNQLGKTLAGGFETAMHATGRYLPWWTGKRFDRPVVGWVCGVTGETVRDTVQKILVGRTGQEGTGAIPKDAIAELVSARGTADLLDTIRVHHVSGGVSIIGLKTYASGREKMQGETLDFAWLDEESPADIYTEILTRTNVGNGPVWMTMTPLMGVSEVVRRFLHQRSPDRKVISMTIDDVEHYSDEEKAKIIKSYPAHELEARTKGIPVLGSGRIFPVAEETIAIEHKEFPPHWPRIGGMDFGWDHPFAAVELVHDRDSDVVYVSRIHRLKEATPVLHAATLRAWGKELPWAWPRDGNRETLEGAGIALAAQYRAQGLNLLHEFAHYVEATGQKSVSVEAGLMDMLTRMQTGRFKVFKQHNDWWEEFRLYHRKDGRVVKEGDDLMAATRYAIMMLRFASTKAAYSNFRRPLKYPKSFYY